MDMAFAERVYCMIKDDDSAAAERELKSVAEEDRTHPVYLLALALVALQDRDDSCAIEAAQKAVTVAEAAGPPVTFAEVLYVLGCALGDADLPERALVAYDGVVERFGGADELQLCELVAKATVNKAYLLGEMHQYGAALESYEQVTQRFADASELALREQVAKALVNGAVLLGTLDRSEEELAAYQEVVTRFGDASELALRKWVAGALFNKGMTMGEVGRPQDELSAYDEVIERFGDATEPELCEQIARAMVNKGWLLSKMRQYDAALEAYGQVVERFGGMTDVLVYEQVAKALLYAGDTLRAMGKPDAARDAYQEVMMCCNDAPAECLRELASRAMVEMVNTIGAGSERERWIQMQDPEIQDQLRGAPRADTVTAGERASLEDIEAFVAACPDDAFGWATLAQRYGEAGRWQEAVAAWERALAVDSDIFADPLAQAAHAEEQYLEAKRQVAEL